MFGDDAAKRRAAEATSVDTQAKEALVISKYKVQVATDALAAAMAADALAIEAAASSAFWVTIAKEALDREEEQLAFRKTFSVVTDAEAAAAKAEVERVEENIAATTKALADNL